MVWERQLQVDEVDGILELTSGLPRKKRDELRSQERGADCNWQLQIQGMWLLLSSHVGLPGAGILPQHHLVLTDKQKFYVCMVSNGMF